MKRNIGLLLTIPFIFFACQEDDLTVTLNQAGNIRVQVVDENKAPVENATVSIGYSSGSSLVEGSTDLRGVYETKLLQSGYFCTVKVTKDRLNFQDSKIIQIFAGETSTVEMNPFLNTGEVSLNFIKRNGNAVDTSLRMGLVEYGNYYIKNIDDILTYANIIKTIPENGRIDFYQLPADLEYRVYVFDNEYIYYTYSDYIFVRKGEKKELNVVVDIY